MHHWGIPRTEEQFGWQRTLKAGNSRSAPLPAAHCLRECVPQRWLRCLGSPEECCPGWFPRWAGHGTLQSDRTDLGVTSCTPALPSVQQDSPAWKCLWDGHISPANTSLLKKGVYLLQVRQLTGIAIYTLLSLPVLGKKSLLVSPYLCVGLQSWQQNTGLGHLLLWSRGRIWGLPLDKSIQKEPWRIPQEGKGNSMGHWVAEVAHCCSVFNKW